MDDEATKRDEEPDESPGDEGGGVAARGKRLSPSSQIGRTAQTGGTPETRPYPGPDEPGRPSVDGANHAADRLTTPLVRRGGPSGSLEPATWDGALDLVAERTRRVLADTGPLGLGFYNSGQLFLEDYYTLAVLVRGGLGTPHLDGNTRLCTATADAALKETFGCDGDPGSITDFDLCDTLFLVGHNVAETPTVLWMRVLDRLAGPDSPRMVVVAPRRTRRRLPRRRDARGAVRRPGRGARALRGALRNGGSPPGDGSDALERVRRMASQVLGKTAVSGTLLLSDLKDLYLSAHRAELAWVVLVQVAKATRDEELLGAAQKGREEAERRWKWVRTRVKDASPQVLVAG